MSPVVLGGLMLGNRSSLAVPEWVKVACGAERRSRRWGGGGNLQQSSLNYVFIKHPLKKYPPHRPGYLAPIKFLYSLRSFSFSYL
jgi:hypothetical protein